MTATTTARNQQQLKQQLKQQQQEDAEGGETGMSIMGETLTDLREQVDKGANTRSRLESAVRGGLRWGFVGCVVSTFLGFMMSPDEFNWKFIVFVSLLSGSIVFLHKLVKSRKGQIFKKKDKYDHALLPKDDALEAGVMPIPDDSADEYSNLLVKNGHKINLPSTELDFPTAMPAPIEKQYPSGFIAEPPTEISSTREISLVRSRLRSPGHRILTAITLAPLSDPSAGRTESRKIFTGFCELSKVEKFTGRLVGRGNDAGQVWSGDAWTEFSGFDDLPLYWYKLPDASPERVAELKNIRDSAITTYGVPKDTSFRTDYVRSVVAGTALPGSEEFPSARGVYFVENENVMAFHRNRVDLADMFHLHVVSRNDNLPNNIVGFSEGENNLEQCQALVEMRKAAMCFVVVNAEWFVTDLGLEASTATEAIPELLAHLQMGFDTAIYSSVWLHLDALLGGLTANSAHPNFVSKWVSFASAWKFANCEGSIPNFDTVETCLGSGTFEKDPKPERFACSPGSLNKAPIDKCPHYIKTSSDGTTYFDMEALRESDVTDNFSSAPQSDHQMHVFDPPREFQPLDIAIKTWIA